MKFTGERYISDMKSAQISYEHWHRYFYATHFVEGKDVLDIASGEGYGTNLLAQTARSVTGVDISEEAVSFATNTYKRDNLQFLRGSLDSIPIVGKKKFDVVVSFETIEHVNATAQKKFLSETKRLLRDEGVFIVSTPNKLLYSDIPHYKNEFHVKEFYQKEFIDFLKKYFSHVVVLGQKICTGSNIWDLLSRAGRGSFTKYEIDINSKLLLPGKGPKGALYFVAVCSDIKTPVVGNSFLVDNSLSLVSEKNAEFEAASAALRQKVVEQDGQVAMLSKEVGAREEWGKGLEQQLKDAHVKIAELMEEVGRRGTWGMDLDRQLKEAQAKTAELMEEVAGRGTWGMDLDRQLKDAQAKIAELMQEVAGRGEWGMGLEQQLRDAQAKIIELTEKVVQGDRKFSALEQQFADAQVTISELTQEVVRRGEWGGGLERQLKESEAAVAELREEAARRDEQFSRLDQQFKDAQAKMSELTQETVRRDEEFFGLDQQFKTAQAMLSQLAQEVVHRGEWGAELERQLKDAQAKTAELMEEVGRRGTWGMDLDRQLKDAQAKTAELMEEVGRRGTWGMDLDRQLKESETVVAGLRKEAAHRDEQFSRLDQQFKDAQVKILELTQEAVRRDEELFGMDQQFKIAQAMLSQLTQEVVRSGEWGAGLDRQLKDAQSKISELTQEAVRHGEKLSRLEPQLKDAESKMLELTQEAVRRDEEFCGVDQQFKVAQAIISELTQEAAHRDEEFSGLDQRLKDAQARILGLTQEAARRDEEFSSVDQQFKSARAIIAELIKEFELKTEELNNEIVRRGEWGQVLDRQLREARNDIAKITSTISWKITHPLREGGRIFWELLSLVRWRLKQSLKFKQSTRPANIQDMKKKLMWAGQAHSRKNIVLATSAQPEVSVIIPIYGQCEYTLRCLASIAKNPPCVPFEVIVVNDASPDDSVKELQNVRGIKLISNSQNQGFIRSCNRGAKTAKGRYLYFLNSDTEVTSGWLDELVRTFDEFPGTGLVGSKLIYPDGTLQEAGGIIWQDGSAWNFGRGQDPALPIYNYAREVDYCSGASIMVPGELFKALGGFDEHYLPAFCEDSDLALKIRDRGYRVIYQPLSVVVHYEGVTSGTDITKGVKAYQVENLKKQFDRWKDRLQHHQANGMDVDNAKDRNIKRRVLIVDKCTPTPDQDSGSMDTFNIALLLREMGFQVTFIPEDNFLYMPRYTTALQRVGVEALYAPYCVSVEDHLKEYGQRYDLVMLVRADVVRKHVKAVRKHAPRSKVIYHTVDLHFLRLSREAELFQDEVKQKAADRMKEIELAGMRSVDVTTVLSTAELGVLRSLLPGQHIHLLPFSRHISGTDKSFKDRHHIVFVGGYAHYPNIDAVQYFVADVMPILRQRLPGICFYIVGSNIPEKIQALATEDVVVVGFVEDLNSFLDKMRVSIAPLRYGAGIKGKISYAMGVGLPTVATSLAAEGMGLTDGEDILIADKTEAFADTIVRLYNDASLWNRISQKGLNFAKNAWGAEAAWKSLDAILKDMGLSNTRGARPLVLYTNKPKIFVSKKF